MLRKNYDADACRRIRLLLLLGRRKTGGGSGGGLRGRKDVAVRGWRGPWRAYTVIDRFGHDASVASTAPGRVGAYDRRGNDDDDNTDGGGVDDVANVR